MTGRKKKTRSDFSPKGPPTLEFKIADLGLERIAAAAPEKDESRLRYYRDFFSSFTMRRSNDTGKLDYQTFARNIRAAGFIEAGGIEIDIFFTTGHAFLVFHEVPDFGRLKEVLPNVDLAKRATLAESLSDESSLVLIRVNSDELRTILAASSKDVPEQPMAQGDSQTAVERIKRLLLDCVGHKCGIEFDLNDFAMHISHCGIFEGDDDRECYIVALDNDPLTYSILPVENQKGPALCYLILNGTPYAIKVEEKLTVE